MTVATISQTNAETQELEWFQQETVLFTFRVDQWSLDWLDQMVPEFCVDCVTQAWNLAWDSEILGPRCLAWSCCPQHCLACQWEHPVSRNHIWQRNWFIFSRDYTPLYPSSSRTLVIDQSSTSNKYKKELCRQVLSSPSMFWTKSWSWSWTTWSWWRPDVWCWIQIRRDSNLMSQLFKYCQFTFIKLNSSKCWPNMVEIMNRSWSQHYNCWTQSLDLQGLESKYFF